MRFAILFSAWILANAISYGNVFLSDNGVFVYAVLFVLGLNDSIEFLHKIFRKNGE